VTLPLQNPLSLACCGDGCAMWWGHLFLLYPQLPPPKQPLHLPPVTLSPCSCVLKPPRGQLRSTSFSFLLAEDMLRHFPRGPRVCGLGCGRGTGFRHPGLEPARHKSPLCHLPRNGQDTARLSSLGGNWTHLLGQLGTRTLSCPVVFLLKQSDSENPIYRWVN
jgi:hypothetical protein